jgi:hypothetical protein
MPEPDRSEEWTHPALKRFIAFEFTPHLLRGRYALGLQSLLFGTALLVLSYKHWLAGGWYSHPAAGLLFVLIGLVALALAWHESRDFRRWVDRAVPVKAWIVQANDSLFKKGTNTHAPCLVLFSLQSGYTSNLAYLQDLAARIYALRGTNPSDPELVATAGITEDEQYVLNRRRVVSAGFTGGPKIYTADLMIDRRCLWKGRLNGPILHCLVEPGDEGRIELIPWQVVGAA